MVRKLVKTLLSLLLMTPVAALALGLGDVQLHSTLNQRLNADIKLLSVNPDEADTVTVSLASYDDFAKVGLERPGYLMFLRFNLEQKPGGEYFVKLTSTDVIREPFLDFLIEVKWRSGRVLREYTLLLDPPVSHRQATPAISAPETVSTAPSVKPAKPEAAATEEEFVPPPSAIPVKPGAKAPVVAEKEAPKQAAPAKSMPAAAPGGIVYGPVKANETLWRIAQQVRPSGDITVQQMMMALLKANPYAFFDNNINRLKKGFVLRIDDPAMIKAMSKAEAAREVSRQTRDWQDYRAAMAKKAPARKPVASAKAPAGAVAAAKKEPKLELVAPGGKSESTGEGAEGSKSVQKDLMLALESSAAQRKENEALQKRVKGLEEQLNDMQRLLELKDSDLAALQKQLREQGQAVTLPSEKTESPEAATTTKTGEAPVAGEEKPAAGEEQLTEKTTEAMPAGEEMAGEKPASEAKPESEAMTGEKPATATETKKPEPVAKPAPKKPAVKKTAPPPLVAEPSVIDLLMENLNYLIGGVAILLVALLLWLKRRRNSGFQESILSGGTSSMLNANEGELASETSFLSDLAVSGMGGGTIHSDEGEVDPLTEADVFMAYGRNQQAEEVLKKALEKNPERQDLNAKLLEVYYNLKDNDKFLALAATAAAGLQSNEELWGKVAAMGHELAPGNGLFGDANAAAASVPVSAGEPVVDDVLDIGLDLDALGSEMESEGADEGLGIDLGLDFGDLEEEEPAAPAEPTVTEDESFDFDLDLGGAEEIAEVPAEESEAEFNLDFGTETAEETSDLDFDLGALGVEEEQPSEEVALKLGEETVGEEDFSMDFNLGAAEEQASEESDELDLGDLGDIDFGDLGLEESTEVESVTAETESDVLDLSDLESASSDFGDFDDLGDLDEEGLLSDSDEIATKLDLAQAYIEMGDNEGARSMLEEVAEAGNDEQKQQAQELLSKV